MGIVIVVVVMKKRYFLLILIFLVIIVFLIFSFLFLNNKKQNDLTMPNFINQDIKKVKEFADKYNIELQIDEEYSQTLDKNAVIKQSLKEGSSLKNIKKINITISKGKMEPKEYAKNKVNELGNIPVMMYHGIYDKQNKETKYIGGNVDKDGYQRTSEAFRNDLEKYYQSGYRMIRLNDYVDGKIDVEFGKSPIVITFDDGLENNIKVTGLDDAGNIIIDPNSAVGILEEFKTKYPDYHVTATFFVNSGLFNQPEYNDKILKWLLDNSYDIGNHSMTHPNFTKIDSVKTQEEIGRLYKILDDKIANRYVKIVALPFGSPYKKNHNNFDYIIKGNVDNYNYETKATLRVGWEADYSPFDINFDPLLIKRIRAYDNNGQDFDIEMNFNLLTNKRYISDGDINTIVIPEASKKNLNNIKNLEVITY